MNFSNLSPADRMKASGLIGLIVVLLFFVVHMLLGVISPKQQKSAAPGPAAGGAPPAPALTTGGGGAPPAADANPFPLDKVASAKRSLRDDPDLNSKIGDPFIQIN